jgi:hypothetical protein
MPILQNSPQFSIANSLIQFPHPLLAAELSLRRLRTDHAENTCNVLNCVFIGPLLAFDMARTT